MRKDIDLINILIFVRDRRTVTWAELCDFFGCSENGDTASNYMRHEIGHMIASKNILKSSNLSKSGGFDGSTSFSLTHEFERFLAHLGISLRNLADEKHRELIKVLPFFGVPKKMVSSVDVFMLMPFSESLMPIYRDHIKPKIESLNIKISRADDFFNTDHIMKDIWTALYHSKFCIADCTGKNPNVFYEMGIAHTLGKPIILITQNIDDVPFDLRSVRYISYQYTPPGMKTFEENLYKTALGVLNDLRSDS
jgi:hypothetical protein